MSHFTAVYVGNVKVEFVICFPDIWDADVLVGACVRFRHTPKVSACACVCVCVGYGIPLGHHPGISSVTGRTTVATATPTAGRPSPTGSARQTATQYVSFTSPGLTTAIVVLEEIAHNVSEFVYLLAGTRTRFSEI